MVHLCSVCPRRAVGRPLPQQVQLLFSKNRVKSAGKALRRHHTGEQHLDVAGLADAIDVLDHWRACHSYPLQKATMGLRSRVATERCRDARVSQRLKRRPTIVDKLTREPRMQLTTMHDIAGCRAVLLGVDDVRRVRRRWTRDRTRVLRVYDYMEEPKASGYRGVHIVVQYDDYPVEVQLRTRLQHAWGVAIERVGPRIGHDLKSGEGPSEVLHLFRVFGDMLASAEGLPVDDFGWEDFRAATEAVDPAILQMVGLVVSDSDVRIVLPS